MRGFGWDDGVSRASLSATAPPRLSQRRYNSLAAQG